MKSSRVVALLILVSVYLLTVHAMLRPRVSAAYRQYFIDRTRSDWAPSYYAATPEDKFQLGLPGLPDFVDYVYGFAQREGWGRWSDQEYHDTAGVVFKKGFTGSYCMQMYFRPSTGVLHKPLEVTFGGVRQSLRCDNADFQTLSLQFDNLQGAQQLDFHFLAPVPRQKDSPPANRDYRRLGLGIGWIRLGPGTCGPAQPHSSSSGGGPDAK